VANTHWFKDSLVARIGAAMMAITLMALVNIASSIAISESTQGDAAAINHAGSLRMQSYRVASEIQRHHRLQSTESRGQALASIDHFAERLAHGTLTSAIPSSSDHPLNQRYRDIQSYWTGEMSPALRLAVDDPLLADEVIATGEQFVNEIHGLVSLLEDRTEGKIKLLGIIQGLSLILTIGVVVISLFDFRNNIIHPLRRLMRMARAASQRDFSARSNMDGNDELALLGKTFDNMASELSISYADLESRAAEKTRELERSHRALNLLHNASRSLYGSDDLCQGAIPLLHQLESLLSIGPVSLYLHDKESGAPFQAVTTFSMERPEHCRSLSCNVCLTGNASIEDKPDPETNDKRLLLPVRTGQDVVGTLEVWYPADRELEGHERHLLGTLSDQLATAVYLQRRMTEEQRLTLMEERAVIARELHDSLAQSLSYLKMQVARLQRLQGDEADPRQEEVIQELRNGLNNGYRQLRELLTTFRLKFDAPGLKQALIQTASEFGERLGHEVTLNYDLPAQLLSPNEEIHILQIVREALANAVKHSQADEVVIDVYQQAGAVKVSVTDNGIGLPASGAPPSHYGLIIMRDRSNTLGGNLQVANRPEGGVKMSLTLEPHGSNLITQAS